MSNIVTRLKNPTVLIIGGGLAGLQLSYLLDKNGIDFTTLDNKKTIGNAGYRGISGDCLDKARLDTELSLVDFDHIGLYSAYGYKISKKTTGYSLKLSEMEEQIYNTISAKDKILTGKKVEKINIEKSLVETKNEKIYSDIIVLASGGNFKLKEQLGIKNRAYAANYGCLVKSVNDMECGLVLDNNRAKGLFAWMMSTGEDEIEVGLSTRDLGVNNYKELLFSIYKVNKLKISDIKSEYLGYAPLYPADQSCGKNWLAIGAAGNGQPVVGVPVYQCFDDAEIAAKTIIDFTEGKNNLSQFQYLWNKKFGRRTKIQNVLQGLLAKTSVNHVDFMMKTFGPFLSLDWV
jgi:flavin-dependent dehydrogenase